MAIRSSAWKIRTSVMLLVLCILIGLFIIYEPLLKSVGIISEALRNESTANEIFITRALWKGQNPLGIIRTDSALLIIIKHTGGKICYDFKSCSKRVRDIQQHHMTVQKMVDIEYNFLIGGDGRIYVGRDWLVQNEVWPCTVDIAFIGNFTEYFPTREMLDAAHLLIEQGEAKGVVDFSDYHIVCHNQTETTDSPGENLFAEVQNWKYYKSDLVRDN